MTEYLIEDPDGAMIEMFDGGLLVYDDESGVGPSETLPASLLCCPCKRLCQSYDPENMFGVGMSMSFDLVSDHFGGAPELPCSFTLSAVGSLTWTNGDPFSGGGILSGTYSSPGFGPYTFDESNLARVQGTCGPITTPPTANAFNVEVQIQVPIGFGTFLSITIHLNFSEDGALLIASAQSTCQMAGTASISW